MAFFPDTCTPSAESKICVMESLVRILSMSSIPRSIWSHSIPILRRYPVSCSVAGYAVLSCVSGGVMRRRCISLVFDKDTPFPMKYNHLCEKTKRKPLNFRLITINLYPLYILTYSTSSSSQIIVAPLVTILLSTKSTSLSANHSSAFALYQSLLKSYHC